jgi:hypothetical protein
VSLVAEICKENAHISGIGRSFSPMEQMMQRGFFSLVRWLQEGQSFGF